MWAIGAGTANLSELGALDDPVTMGLATAVAGASVLAKEALYR